MGELKAIDFVGFVFLGLLIIMVFLAIRNKVTGSSDDEPGDE